MVEWTITREYGTGIIKAECKERGIIITKNTYDEARVAMLEALVYTGTLSDADITAIITEVTEDVLAQCNTTTLKGETMTLKDSSIVANRIKTINLLNEVDRPGIPDLIEFLDNTNFFLSPASTKYHNNFYGGLCLHSLNVTKLFIPRIKKIDTTLTRESAILCGLLHDICKIGYYNVINGEWKSSKNHAANGLHGVLSVDLAKTYIKLTPEEEDVIKYHMGLFSVLGYVKEYSVEELYESISKYPSVQIFASCDNEEAHMKRCKQ